MVIFKKNCTKCEKEFRPDGRFQRICNNCSEKGGNKSKPTTEEELNYETYKDFYNKNNQDMRLLIKAFIKKCPKGILNQVLKEEKIIKRDWLAKGEQYGEYYNES